MAGELILIIEDNKKNRKLVREVLQVKGYQTFESETAEEGLKLAVEKQPALILMDIQLPVLTESLLSNGCAPTPKQRQSLSLQSLHQP